MGRLLQSLVELELNLIMNSQRQEDKASAKTLKRSKGFVSSPKSCLSTLQYLCSNSAPASSRAFANVFKHAPPGQLTTLWEQLTQKLPICAIKDDDGNICEPTNEIDASDVKANESSNSGHTSISSAGVIPLAHMRFLQVFVAHLPLSHHTAVGLTARADQLMSVAARAAIVSVKALLKGKRKIEQNRNSKAKSQSQRKVKSASIVDVPTRAHAAWTVALLRLWMALKTFCTSCAALGQSVGTTPSDLVSLQATDLRQLQTILTADDEYDADFDLRSQTLLLLASRLLLLHAENPSHTKTTAIADMAVELVLKLSKSECADDRRSQSWLSLSSIFPILCAYASPPSLRQLVGWLLDPRAPGAKENVCKVHVHTHIHT